MKLLYRISALAIMTLLFTTNCSTTYQYVVNVDSLADDSFLDLEKTYSIASGDKDVSENDLVFKNASQYLENALKQTGYTLTDKNNANMEVRFSFKISDPQEVSDTKTYAYSSDLVRTQIVSIFYKQLKIDVYENKTGKHLWTVTASNSNNERDFRSIIPVMLVASQKYFGISTSKIDAVRVKENDPRIQELKKIK